MARNMAVTYGGQSPVELAFGQKTFKKQYFLPPETMIKPVVNIAELDQTMFDDISPMTDLQVSGLNN